MMMTLIVWCLLIVIASILGGRLSDSLKLSHRSLQMVMSFVTSLMTAGGMPRGMRLLVNSAFALMCPLGAALFVGGIQFVGGARRRSSPGHWPFRRASSSASHSATCSLRLNSTLTTPRGCLSR